MGPGRLHAPFLVGICWRRHWQRTVQVLLWTASVGLHAQTYESNVVGVVLNTVEVSNGEVIYADPASPQLGLWIKQSSLTEWRLLPDPDVSRQFEGVAYGRVCGPSSQEKPDAIAGLSLVKCVYDESTALLTLVADAGRIVPLRVEALRLARLPPSDQNALGAYVNYDIFGIEGLSRLRGLAAEGHLFSRWGSGYLNFGLLHSEGQTRVVSSFAGWQWDMPERGTSLSVGGVVGDIDSLRPPLPLLGIRYGTNTNLQPDVLRVQRPWVTGVVERSSRADLFVDGLFRRSADVPYGPYTFEADALLSGLGQLQLVQTDQRGEQSVRNVSYYFAPQLLPTGLVDYSVQAGILGPDANRLSANGEPVALLSLRRGMSDVHTLSLNAVIGKQARLLGGTSDFLLNARGVLRAGLSVFSRGEAVRSRWMVGHEFQSRNFSSLFRLEATPGETAQTQSTSVPSRLVQTLLPADRQASLFGVSWSPNARIQTSVSLSNQINLNGERSRVVGFFGTYRHSTESQLTIGVQQITQARTTTSLQMNWLLQLGARHLALTSVLSTPERTTVGWSVQSLNTSQDDDNTGQYRVFGETGQDTLMGASYQRDETFGRWRTEVQSLNNDTTLRAGLTGSVGYMQGHAFAARRIDNSFIVVDADGQAGVPVFFENRYAGKTDRNGKLLLPDARAYQGNQVNIDAASLPIEYTVSQDQIRVVPTYRAGATARFDISDGGILLKVLDVAGAPLPAGARVTISTQGTATVVGSRSDIFINRAKMPARIEITLPTGSCRLEYQPDNDAEDAIRCQ